mgnify:FL=1|jgi:hypothetical protein
MNLFDYLNDKPAVALCAVDALDDSVLSKLPSLQISIGDNIDIDTAENPEGQVSVIYSRRVSATPEPLISINISFRIICTLNDEGMKLDKNDILELLRKDKKVISMCAAKASLLLSQLTTLMAGNTPIVTPPTFVDD